MEEAAIFKRKRMVSEHLLSYGFVRTDGAYCFSKTILDDQFRLFVTISDAGHVDTKVIDRSSNDEYVLHRVPGAAGAFTGSVKAAYEEAMLDIAEKCFETDVFKSDQAKRLIRYVRDTYGDELEFLWQKFPDNAVVRRKDNQKWYAAILTVSRRKLGFHSDEKIEILDLRMKPEDIQAVVDGTRYLPGYHMNKKHWITICLDGTLQMEEICARIDESYKLALK